MDQPDPVRLRGRHQEERRPDPQGPEGDLLGLALHEGPEERRRETRLGEDRLESGGRARRAQDLEPALLAGRPGEHAGAGVHAGHAPRIRGDQEEAAARGARGPGVLPRAIVSPARVLLLAALLVTAAPAAAPAQVFVASKPHPQFEIGPLFVRASVSPKLGPVDVDIFWSVVVPANRSVSDAEGLALVWPAALVPDAKRGRSEEHTSELQSLAYLVCRLLLEKKK